MDSTNTIPRSVRVDESNAESTDRQTGVLLFPTGNLGEKLPCGVRMRYVNTYLQSNPRVRRKFYISTPELFTVMLQQSGAQINGAVYPSADGLDADGGLVDRWTITSFVNEKYGSYPQNAVDSGLIDGDLEN